MKKYINFVLLIFITLIAFGCEHSDSSTTQKNLFVALVFPADGATNQSTTIPFSWDGNVETYDLYLGTDSLTLGKIVSDVTVKTYTKNSLASGVTYYWKVVGKTDSWSDTTNFRKFTTLSLIGGLSFPPGGATNILTNIVFSWVGNSDTYDVYLKTGSSDFTIVASGIDSTKYTESNLSEGTTYSWKVVGKKGSDVDTSEVKSFTTTGDSSGVRVETLSPSSGAIGQNTNINLVWNGNAEIYDVYFGESSLSLNKVAEKLITRAYTKGGLSEGTTYYWKVVGAKNGVSDTSVVWSFTTKISVALSSPSNGATAQDTNGTLTWTGTATTYDVSRGTSSSSLIKVAEGLTTNSYQNSGLSNNTTYYWKVVGTKGSQTVESSVGSFTTKISVSLSSPSNGATSQNISTTLSWSNVATTYDLYLGTDSLNLTKIVSGITGTSYTKSGLTEGTTYYWKVVGKKGSELDTSDVWKFTTKISVSLSSPVNGATYIPTDTTFTWSGTATTYDFYLGTSSSNLSNIASDLTTPSFSKNGLEEVTTYYWKVVGKKDNQTAESSVRSFSTKSNISLAMVSVEAGTFNMGPGDLEKDTVHSVTLTKNYYMGKYEVTVAELVKVYNQAKKKGINGLVFSSTSVTYEGKELLDLDLNPTACPIEYSNSTTLSVKSGRGNYPVIFVTWYGATAFAKFMDSITGDFKYRLPTEAEWEYAARGGKNSQGFKYSGSNTLDAVAWYYNNTSGTPYVLGVTDKGTFEVGKKLANELGIYDMSGNVDEWCSDWYGDYSSKAQTDPTGPTAPPTTGDNHVKRGGCWFNEDYPVTTRSSYDACYTSIGFRIVKEY